MAIGLPVEGPLRLEDGRYVTDDPASGVSLSVSPLSDGVQIVVEVAASDAPTEFQFTFASEGGVLPTLLNSGEVALTSESGRDLGLIEAPWAYDANGAAVPTHFEVRGSSVIQVVDHTSGDYAYPITADPSIKNCNLYTATCVTFSKGEVRNIAGLSGVSAVTKAICAIVPNPALKVGCAVVLRPVVNSVKSTFNMGSSQGKCVELKFNRIPPAVNALIGWKVVSC
ncbi:hypothetical protein [Aeromicrobium sp. Leaf350]|uniref:hypothetical protein n=1 Tax=Aeromicrobium sp. Leaf350 TaxID=2876565 RepID=UPI001E4C0CD4|nr:hypothetical protein [Aeromicrobium sp. Leaf350]